MHEKYLRTQHVVMKKARRILYGITKLSIRYSIMHRGVIQRMNAEASAAIVPDKSSLLFEGLTTAGFAAPTTNSP